MKIRKLTIKNYKLFDNLELDFTDKNDQTLDTIVLAGVNGSGKTSLLALLKAIFSTQPENKPSHKLKDSQIKLELEISSDTEKVQFLKIIQPEYTKIARSSPENSAVLEMMSLLIKTLKSRYPILTLWYKAERRDNQTKIQQDDFMLFDWLSQAGFDFKLCYIPAETYLNTSSTPFSKENPDLEAVEQYIAQQDKGLVRVIDFSAHKYAVEKYIVNSVVEKLLADRKQKVEDVIQESTQVINNSLSDFKLVTKLVDITAFDAIFESFNRNKIGINDLSHGEKQLFYQAVYLNNLNLQNSIIMVDEPETSLHPSWQQAILKLYQNAGQNNQVIVATHSPFLIASVKPDNLFLLTLNQKTQTCEVINAAKASKHTKGLEPNRIIREIMEAPLRDIDTQKRIDALSERLRLYPEDCDKPEIQALINDLIEDLGRQDPFILRLNHQLMMIKRKQTQLNEIHR
jgi:ABC-type cobalamin/Fe3+-siderophores transport system ATPase subunit